MKRLIALFLLLLIAIPNVYGIASKTCSTSYNYPHTHVNGQPADATKENANNTGINNNGKYACADIDLAVGLADNNTITGANTYTMAQTFSVAPVCDAGLTFGSDATDGITNSYVIIDADNAGAEAASSVRFQRGSTDAADARIEWNVTNDRFDFTTDGSTLADLYAGDGDATGEVVTYDQVVFDTGNQTIAGAKTFSTAVLSTDECNASTEYCTKNYIDTADAAISQGGCSVGSGAPVGACSAGACYYDISTSTAPIGYLCYGADMTTWVKYDLDSIDTANPILTSTDVDITGTVAASATDSLLGLGSDIASGDASGTYFGINAPMSYAGNLADWQVNGTSKFKVDENGAITTTAGATLAGAVTGITDLTVSGTISGVTDPSTAQQAATKNYVDTQNKYMLLYNQTADVTVTAATNTTIIGTGSGTASISANTLAAGDVVKITAYGYYSNGAGAGRTLSLAGCFGISGISGITIADGGSGYFIIEEIFTIRTIGMSGTARGVVHFNNLSTSSASKGITSTSNVAIDTTASNNITTLVAWDSTATTPSITVEGLIVEKYSI